MTRQDFETVKQSYQSYMARYSDARGSVAGAIHVKLVHIEQVVHEMKLLVEALYLDEFDTFIALSIAQLHDIARPEQLVKYGTMKDADSENHALMAVRIIKEEEILGHLERDEQELILTAVANHNRYAVEDGLDERTLLFCKLIRDADKLDIWRVFIELDSQPESSEAATAFFGLEERDEVTPSVWQAIMEGHIADYRELQTRCDFRLLVMGWVFDLNFQHSLNRVVQQGFLDTMKSRIPLTPNVENALKRIETFINERTQQQVAIS